jgi:hypothetical protein
MMTKSTIPDFPLLGLTPPVTLLEVPAMVLVLKVCGKIRTVFATGANFAS